MLAGFAVAAFAGAVDPQPSATTASRPSSTRPASTGTPTTVGVTTTPVTTTPVTTAPVTTASVTTSPDTTTPTTTMLPTTSAPATTSTAVTTSTVAVTVPATAPPPSTSEPAQRRPPDPARTTHPTVPPPVEPFEPEPEWVGEAALTGSPAGSDVTERPALVVKIDNAPGGRPQWNLADADLVIEENVEDITRFVAVYHSRLPDRIGPVRSVRTTDLDLLSAMNRPILAWSGGNPGVTKAVRDWEEIGLLFDLSAQRSGCYYRSRSRRAPHNLVLDPLCALASAPTAGPARPLFPRDAVDPVAWEVTPTERFEVRMDGLTVTWVWDPASGTYLRRQNGGWHTDVDGQVVAASNVIVMQAHHEPSIIDARSPHAVTTGSGLMVLHRGGVAIAGSWWREDARDMFFLRDTAGAPLTVANGTVFVELVR